MKIRKVDDKPMVIHTKEKAKIHAHEPKGAKIKGSNIYTVERGPKTAGANFIFTNRFGNPHNPQAVNRAIKRIVDAHNAEEEVEAKKKKREPIMLPRFSCHIFRHTFASRFCENETNVKVIQEVMGHADVSTTMNIYAEANPEVTREALEKLAKNMDVF